MGNSGKYRVLGMGVSTTPRRVEANDYWIRTEESEKAGTSVGGQMGPDRVITNGVDSANPGWLRECADLEHEYDSYRQEVPEGSAAKTGWPYDVPSQKQVGGEHYKKYAIQPSEYILRNNIGWLEGNAIKYLTRWKDKGGRQDLEKAKHYVELLLEWTK
jgi:hypothetical protein